MGRSRGQSSQTRSRSLTTHQVRLQNLRWRLPGHRDRFHPFICLPPSLSSLAHDQEAKASCGTPSFGKCSLSFGRSPRSTCETVRCFTNPDARREIKLFGFPRRVQRTCSAPSPACGDADDDSYGDAIWPCLQEKQRPNPQFFLQANPQEPSVDASQPFAARSAAKEARLGGKGRNGRLVRFAEQLEVEVPIINSRCSRLLPARKVRPRRLQHEDQARRNLARLSSNHENLVLQLQSCFAGLVLFGRQSHT
mmetsp:Transcript_44265/g.80190  ORF Transcript_44265/g.80190 Transcript_44265/m.80190 type:complete len:251 (-) Transcript_44265:88-840(-)